MTNEDESSSINQKPSFLMCDEKRRARRTVVVRGCSWWVFRVSRTENTKRTRWRCERNLTLNKYPGTGQTDFGVVERVNQSGRRTDRHREHTTTKHNNNLSSQQKKIESCLSMYYDSQKTMYRIANMYAQYLFYDALIPYL